jgi:putative ABC transport system permease protein
MRWGARGLSVNPSTRHFRTALTVGQMALAMILLTGSWLLVRSFEQMQQVAPGYDARDLSITELQIPRSMHGDSQTIQFIPGSSTGCATPRPLNPQPGLRTSF